MSNGIVFEVETTRILKILASEIYDSPLALLRENLQNAYDAVRVRFIPQNEPVESGRIALDIAPLKISISDNGVGMTEQVLREHFWRAGSSGKRSEAAKKAGVVGTFGIGAMANFGVCTRLTVITRAVGTNETLTSVAERDTLSISKECISLERSGPTRDFGTTVIADLEPQAAITEAAAKNYLEPYVALLPVPVLLNGNLISQRAPDDRLQLSRRTLVNLGSRAIASQNVNADVEVFADSNSLVVAKVSSLRISGTSVGGYLTLVQSGGQLFGLRSSFGLAPIPSASTFHFGGIADLAFLQPTAGREAISRESVDQVNVIVSLAERAVAETLAASEHADRNTAFLQYVVNTGRTQLADRVTIHVWPEDKDVPLGSVKEVAGKRSLLYYGGRDDQILRLFGNETTYLLQLAQGNPRRQLHQRYVTSVLQVSAVPDTAQVIREYRGTELSPAEASIVIRLAGVLRDDYLIANVDVIFADISHGVTVLPIKMDDLLIIYLSKSGAAIPPLVELFRQDWQYFPQFIKDFARNIVYPRVQQHVPSSTREGADALKRMLERNRELYRYEETERGEIDDLLGDYLTGNTNIVEVLRRAKASVRAQAQRVSADQVGTVENVLLDVVRTPDAVAAPAEGQEFAAAPPIVRDDIKSDLKLLTTDTAYPLLNGFTMLLGLSDRLVREYGEFFRWPHSTRIIWGGHRVVYIVSDPTAKNSLYYDIELKTPLEGTQASGGVFPTTTLITKRRIYVPVPAELRDAFAIKGGAKEFYVRFDTLSAVD
jgi:molecular chaperone HtpG